MTPIRYIGIKGVETALEHVDVVGVVEEVLRAHGRGATILPDEAYLAWKPPSGGLARSINMPGAIGLPTLRVGSKVINANPANVDTGRPRASGLVLLFDVETAEVTAILAAAPISAARTAAVSAVAARHLATAVAGRLAVIGCGPLGEAHARLVARELPALHAVDLVDRVPARARDVATTLAGVLPAGVDVRVCSTAEEAVRAAAVVVTATATTQGYVPIGWIDRGALVLHVSLDDLLPEAIVGADVLVVDDWGLVAADQRRILGRLVADGRVVAPGSLPAPGTRAVDATLGDVLIGRHPGRSRDDERIVVNPFGMSITDVAVAAAVDEVSMRLGVAEELTR